VGLGRPAPAPRSTVRVASPPHWLPCRPPPRRGRWTLGRPLPPAPPELDRTALASGRGRGNGGLQVRENPPDAAAAVRTAGWAGGAPRTGARPHGGPRWSARPVRFGGPQVARRRSPCVRTGHCIGRSKYPPQNHGVSPSPAPIQTARRLSLRVTSLVPLRGTGGRRPWAAALGGPKPQRGGTARGGEAAACARRKIGSGGWFVGGEAVAALVDGDATATQCQPYGTFRRDRFRLVERADEAALTNQSSKRPICRYCTVQGGRSSLAVRVASVPGAGAARRHPDPSTPSRWSPSGASSPPPSARYTPSPPRSCSTTMPPLLATP